MARSNSSPLGGAGNSGDRHSPDKGGVDGGGLSGSAWLLSSFYNKIINF